jgi:hypothetical protein
MAKQHEDWEKFRDTFITDLRFVVPVYYSLQDKPPEKILSWCDEMFGADAVSKPYLSLEFNIDTTKVWTWGKVRMQAWRSFFGMSATPCSSS